MTRPTVQIRALEPYKIQIGVLAALWVVIGVTSPSLRGPDGLYSVLLGFALLGLVALGVAITVIAGEFDISIAAIAAVGGAVAVRSSSMGLVPAILAGTIFGLIFGAGQGWLIARLRISSLVITVGTLILLGGVSYLVCGNRPITVSDLAMTDPLLLRWGFVSPDIIVAIVVFAVIGVFLSYARAGREIYAIGGARDEASAAGVKVSNSLVIAFALSGSLAGLAGGLAAMKGGSIAPGAYSSLLLQGVSAALIGGISLYGGRGTVWNVVLGTAVLSLVAAGLYSHGSQDYLVQLASGALLLLVVVLQFATSREGGGVFSFGSELEPKRRVGAGID